MNGIYFRFHVDFHFSFHSSYGLGVINVMNYGGTNEEKKFILNALNIVSVNTVKIGIENSNLSRENYWGTLGKNQVHYLRTQLYVDQTERICAHWRITCCPSPHLDQANCILNYCYRSFLYFINY